MSVLEKARLFFSKIASLSPAHAKSPARRVNREVNGVANGAANGVVNGAANGTTNGVANGSAKETTTDSSEPAFQTWTIDAPYLNLHCELGEGPFYEKESNSLRFVDIINHRVHTVSLTEGPDSVQTIQLDCPVTVTADIEGVDPREKILVGVKYGLAILDRKTGKYEYVAKLSDPANERVRTNDGAADSKGRFWIGTMTDFNLGPFQPEGSLFRFDSKTKNEVFIKDLTIPNSIGWSPDNKTMYFTNSTSGEVLAFDYNVEDGTATNQRVFYKHEGTGSPDGFRVDTEGNIWHAVYGEFRVLKLSPQGKLIGEIKLPTRNITCCQFVGTELYITTAGDGQAEGGEKSKELGGALYKIDVGATGLDLFKVKLE